MKLRKLQEGPSNPSRRALFKYATLAGITTMLKGKAMAMFADPTQCNEEWLGGY